MIGIFSHRLPVVAMLHVLLDALAASAAFVLVTQLRSPTLNLATPGFVGVVFSFALIVLLGMATFGLYRPGEDGLRTLPWKRLIMALAFSVGIAYLLAAFLPDGQHYTAGLFEATLLAGAAVVPIRAAIDMWSRRGLLASSVLVVGTGDEALAVGQTVERIPGLALLGYVAAGDGDTCVVPKRLLLAGASNLESMVGKHKVRMIIVAVRERRGGMLPLPQLLSCRLRGVEVLDVPHFFERVTGQVPIESLKASWLIFGEGFRQDWLRNAVKRTFDLAASLLLLIPALPMMALTALLIRMESRGAVLFRQERVGMGGRTFNVLKFRSMRQDAERDGKPVWASTDDPRITRVGRFIRRTRIDELPQVFNVLKGEMSFVGPRPERPYFVEQLTKELPFYGARHTVKPGITGWAQVRYSYGASVEDAGRKLQYDLYYVKNHTLLLDLVILLETIRVVLFGEGAR